MSNLLLSTKLYHPSLRPGFISRPRLLTKLNRGLSGRLTLISAPAGFGKTSLLAEWLQQEKETAALCRFAWLSLDQNDNDLNRFLAYLIAAVQTVTAACGQDALARLQSSESPSTADTILTMLINELSQLEDKIGLIMDDYHLISSPAIHTALHFLLDHLPPQLHLIIATRSDPPLALARWRARGLLNEIRAADLRFTAAETAAFLHQTLDYPLSEENMNRLAKRTEGWAAGLQLAALSLRHLDTAAADQFVINFGGSNRHIFDYLVEEVLQRQPRCVQQFLLYTTHLERLTASLCDAVTNLHEWDETQTAACAIASPLTAQAILNYLTENNLFLVPLDTHGRWFRYHTFFAETVQARLQEIEPERLPQLHRRAGRWYAAHNDPEQAIRHALAAQDTELAADLIEQETERLWTQGHLDVALTWLSALPQETRLTRLRLGLLYSWLLYLHDRWDEAVENISHLAASIEALALDAPHRRLIHGRYAAIQGAMSTQQQKAATTIRWMKMALADLPADDIHWRQVAMVGLGLAQLADGEAAAAMKTLHQTALTCEQHNDLYLAFAAWWHQLEACWAQGRLQVAAVCLQRIEALAEQDEGNWLNLMGHAAVGWGMLAYERNELKTAARYLTAALPQIWPGGQVRVVLAGYLTFAKVAQAQGDPEEMHRHLETAAQLVSQSNLTAEQPLLAATTARLLLAEEQLLEAHWQLESQQITSELPADFRYEIGLLTLVRLYLAEHRSEEAIALLNRLQAPAQTAERHGSLIEIYLLQALALAQQQQLDRAVAVLQQALELAEPEPYGRLFINEGRPLRYLLRQLTPHSPYVTQLLAQIEGGTVAPSLADPLTERELEILHLVAEGATNREIAEQLVITLGTVKGHLNHILSKLDAQNRTEAVALGRELHLL